MVTTTTPESLCLSLSLEDFMAHPPKHMEWVDGKLVETTGMTVKHSPIQSKLDGYWRNYKRFNPREEVSTQLVRQGFRVSLDEWLAGLTQRSHL